ncbi:sterol desaturase family protein [Mangrovimicrobium sediminis]|uniref:Sterol desaturase family protein n=1 Tax=Mangrovimicrobium sediminis TaxID=2562682 RepID=A0A4Z0LW46_9GAMM|nr:sterol desaturase family protein [Haliea sp. SAOS-164]TGD71613.1 sterol desaturase family protein [Haliea sp. SAOS-164]
MTINSQTIYIFTAITFALFMLLESLAPRRDAGGELGARWANNFGLAALAWYANAVAGTWLVVWLAGMPELQDLALLPPEVAQQPLVGFGLLLLVSEFLGYCAHVGFHKIRCLWPVHAVHHADTGFDVSTSYRHHPVEPLILLPLVVPVVVLLGVTPLAAALYRLFAVAITVFSHANVRLPEGLDRVLRWFVLTPDYHRIHHCSDPHYTNSNYGTMLPWFDYLFGTARSRPYAEQAQMELGLEYWRAAKDMRLDRQLLMPLRGIAAVRRPAP